LVLSLVSTTVWPPDGAADASRTVPTTGVPPTTVVWLRVTLVTAGPVAAGVIASEKWRVAAACVAVISAEALAATEEVLTTNDAVSAPGTTVTPVGTEADGLVVLNDTVTPLAVAGAVRVTVPVAEEPPVTDNGVMLRFDSVGALEVTVNNAVLLTPFALAVITEELVPAVVPGVTVNVALEAPAATVTLAGTLAATALPLVKVTTTPPSPAGPLRVTVPVLVAPSTTVAGSRLSAARVGPAGGDGDGGGEVGDGVVEGEGEGEGDGGVVTVQPES